MDETKLVVTKIDEEAGSITVERMSVDLEELRRTCHEVERELGEAYDRAMARIIQRFSPEIVPNE